MTATAPNVAGSAGVAAPAAGAPYAAGTDNGQPHSVALRGATKAYGPVVAVSDVDLAIRRRELFTFLGPSGSGKTTLLRLIAGLIDLTSGEIIIDGEDVTARPTWDRNIGVVFQSLALFPHMDVFGNVAFPLRMRRIGRAEIRRRVTESLGVVGLPNLADRGVHELSGGQRQRVALARALVYNPTLLLLDEPLGALDKRLREQMQLEIVRLHQAIDVTIINVTHDQREALMMSDRVGVMRDGRLEQVDSGESLYRRPCNRFVAEFLGNANLLAGTLDAAGAKPQLRLGDGQAVPVRPDDLGGAAHNAEATLVLRAEDLELAAPGSAADAGLRGRVHLRVFEGSAVYYEIEVPGAEAPVKVISGARGGSFAPADDVLVRWQPEEAVVLVGPAA